MSGSAAEDIARFLSLCQVPTTGGFAGGPVPGQTAHLAPTYAAINTLVTIGTKSALEVIDRKALKAFLMRMKTPDGAFQMHDDGECDVRGVYIAMVRNYLQASSMLSSLFPSKRVRSSPKFRPSLPRPPFSSLFSAWSHGSYAHTHAGCRDAMQHPR